MIGALPSSEKRASCWLFQAATVVASRRIRNVLYVHPCGNLMMSSFLDQEVSTGRTVTASTRAAPVGDEG